MYSLCTWTTEHSALPEPLDITGERYGRLVALRRAAPSPSGRTRWLFRCDCGQETIATTGGVRTGITKSCGCLRREVTATRSTLHGHTRNRETSHEYYCWAGAKARCTNPQHISYALYGAAGVAMCDRWLSSFADFAADMGPCPPGLTLDRIDNDRGYEPGNCRWATPAEQERNKRNSVRVVHNGVGLNLVDYAQALGVNCGSLRTIMARHRLSPEDAVAHLMNSPRCRRGRRFPSKA